MSKPIVALPIRSLEGKAGNVRAIVDTGSHYTIIRQDCVPAGAMVIQYPEQQILGTAQQSGQLHVVARTILVMDVNGHPIEDEVCISPDLKCEFILGAKTMQAWDISVKNDNGRTTILVGRDMNDPDIQTVL